MHDTLAFCFVFYHRMGLRLYIELKNVSKSFRLLHSYVTFAFIRFRLSRKQKKLPVKIGLCGETEKYPVYKDIRIRTLGRVVGFAESERILGISCFCDSIIQNPRVLQEINTRNLVLSTWGEDNNKEEIREKQRKMGVNVLCFDRLVITKI